MTSLNGDLNAPPSEHQHVLNACREHDVRFVRLWFTDLLGQLKSVAITLDELPAALEKGVEFDGASIEGFARHDESDMVRAARPGHVRRAALASAAASRRADDLRHPSPQR